MYNSSIKGQLRRIHFSSEIIEVPHKVFFNDMSKTYMRKEFMDCDVVFSEIAWQYGYSIFNDRANNVPCDYASYMNNIHNLILELGVPAFIVCGKSAARYFVDAKAYPISIKTAEANMSGCQLWVWNYDYQQQFKDTKELITFLSGRFNKCLDFSCGYGTHLLKFNDFVACDIDRDCLTYLSILVQERERCKVDNGQE